MAGKNLLLCGFSAVPNAVLADRVVTGGKAGKRPVRPEPSDCFRRCVGSQTNMWRLLHGEQYRLGIDTCLASLLGLRNATPEISKVDFLEASRGLSCTISSTECPNGFGDLGNLPDRPMTSPGFAGYRRIDILTAGICGAIRCLLTWRLRVDTGAAISSTDWRKASTQSDIARRSRKS